MFNKSELEQVPRSGLTAVWEPLCILLPAASGWVLITTSLCSLHFQPTSQVQCAQLEQVKSLFRVFWVSGTSNAWISASHAALRTPSSSPARAACAGFHPPSICWLHVRRKGQQPVSSEPSLFSFNPSHAVTTRSPSSDGGSYCTQGVVSVFLLMLQSLYFPLLPAQGCSAPPSAAQIRLFQPKNTKALQWKNTRTRPNHEHMCPNLCCSRTE